MQGGLGEAHVETYQAAEPADGRGDGRRGTATGLGVRGLAQGAVVEEVELVVGLGRVYAAVWVDVDCAVV